MLRRVIDWLSDMSLEQPVRLAMIVSISVLVVVSAISYPFWSADFLEGAMVEAYGMVFDLFVIGCCVFWLNHIGEKKREIKRYQEEIIDFLDWKTEEATQRIVGSVKRLNRYGVTSIELREAYLNDANLQEAGLKGANLSGANLDGAMLRMAEFVGADLVRATLNGANLREAILGGAKPH